MLSSLGLGLCLVHLAPAQESPPPKADAPPTLPAPAQAGSETPDADASAPTPAADPVAPAPTEVVHGALVIGPGAEGEITVRDETRQIARVTARLGHESLLRLTPGTYSLIAADGQDLGQLAVSPGETVRYSPTLVEDGPVFPEGPVIGETVIKNSPYDDPGTETSDEDADGVGWRGTAAPWFSAALPGLGQIINREPGKGVGILIGTLGLGLGAATIYAAGSDEFAAVNGWPQDFAADAIRLGALGALTGTLQLVYAGQIMDAYASSHPKQVEPVRDYKLAFELTRMATVGLNPQNEGVSLLADWSMAVIGQVRPRFTLGVADISVKTDSSQTRSTLQAGLRTGYRFVDRERVWLGAAIGTLMQASFRDVAPSQLDPNGEWGTEGAITAAPYAQLEIRWFLLDRWSLHLMPRASLPLGTRYYRNEGSIASQSLTLEMGSGVGVHF